MVPSVRKRVSGKLRVKARQPLVLRWCGCCIVRLYEAMQTNIRQHRCLPRLLSGETRTCHTQGNVLTYRHVWCRLLTKIHVYLCCMSRCMCARWFSVLNIWRQAPLHLVRQSRRLITGGKRYIHFIKSIKVLRTKLLWQTLPDQAHVAFHQSEPGFGATSHSREIFARPGDCAKVVVRNWKYTRYMLIGTADTGKARKRSPDEKPWQGSYQLSDLSVCIYIAEVSRHCFMIFVSFACFMFCLLRKNIEFNPILMLFALYH